MSVNSRLSPDWLAALSTIKTQADSLGIPFMVIGASARDILLNLWNISPTRATRDVDLAIEIASWGRFEELRNALVATGFFQSNNQLQRLTFEGHLPIDLVPYGAIERSNSEISWPPDHAVLMSVAGMKDAFDSSLTLPLSESPNPLEIHVASAAGIALLKLIAWEDRKLSTTKDAEDLYFLLRHYIDLGNQNHLQSDHEDLFEDFNTAHARLLGRDLLEICSSETLLAVKSILDRETAPSNESILVRDMLPRRAESDQISLCRKWLTAMWAEMFGMDTF